MYLEHYKLNQKPFQITTDPRFLWLGEKHKEALATLRYGIVENRGFLLLTGEVGTGKTLLINRLVTLLDIDTVVATLTDPDLESMDFYNLLADGLKMERTFESKGAFLIHLRDFLHQSYSRQQQVLLIIDESQRLNHRLMEDIRVLSNIELHDRKLINIFFVGQQEFNSILMTPQNRALAQRITVRYHIEPLDEKETREYIEHRLKVAGSTRQIFDLSALREIYHFSGGIPRLINIICDHALLTGYARSAKQINDAFVKECAEELRIPVKKSAVGQDQGEGDTQILNTLLHVDADPQSKPVIPPSTNQGVQGRAEADQKDQKTKEQSEEPGSRSAAWKFAYTVMVIVLIGIVAFAITHFTSSDQPRWDTDDLTPQKYKDSLEREKEILSSQMNTARVDDSPGKNDKPAASAPMQPDPDLPQQPRVGTLPADQRKDDLSGFGARTGAENTKTAATTAVSSIAKNDVGEIEPLPLIKADLIIQFNINSNEIEEQSFAILDRVANYLARHPDEIINVIGYTDSSGTAGYNESVSLFRANNVKSYLIAKGVEPVNIKVLAMGSRNPIASNDTAEGRRKNRRVEIEFPGESGGRD